ncbi:MAG: pyridoxamine 5'-phosphate oxidase [Bacteroidales bacterium]|jgi:pyridoxamine 5'-phosphate oxidase|nr:pyridoxamine 5'-phosphate oxidase [Bacteroidales bacterium]
MTFMKQFRKEFKRFSLSEPNTYINPFDQFNKWFQEAAGFNISEPNAMALATAGVNGMPTIRIVLLKEIENDGFIFFTNYNSRKAKQISENNQAALLFFWEALERQIRIEGMIEKANEITSDDYFHSRTRESQAGSIVSKQSEIIEGRESLEDEFKNLLDSEIQQFKRPEYWGGYKLYPKLFEFWQGREHRLHDRIQYRLDDGKWIRERLAP